MTLSRPSCRRSGCQCTHDAPCERGWIWNDDGTEVKPCPVCRWDRQPRTGEGRDRWLERMRDQDADWARKHGGG